MALVHGTAVQNNDNALIGFAADEAAKALFESELMTRSEHVVDRTWSANGAMSPLTQVQSLAACFASASAASRRW